MLNVSSMVKETKDTFIQLLAFLTTFYPMEKKRFKR